MLPQATQPTRLIFVGRHGKKNEGDSEFLLPLLRGHGMVFFESSSLVIFVCEVFLCSSHAWKTRENS
jgi:hypothetical protein